MDTGKHPFAGQPVCARVFECTAQAREEYVIEHFDNSVYCSLRSELQAAVSYT